MFKMYDIYWVGKRSRGLRNTEEIYRGDIQRKYTEEKKYDWCREHAESGSWTTGSQYIQGGKSTRLRNYIILSSSTQLKGRNQSIQKKHIQLNWKSATPGQVCSDKRALYRRKEVGKWGLISSFCRRTKRKKQRQKTSSFTGKHQVSNRERKIIQSSPIRGPERCWHFPCRPCPLDPRARTSNDHRQYTWTGAWCRYSAAWPIGAGCRQRPLARASNRWMCRPGSPGSRGEGGVSILILVNTRVYEIYWILEYMRYIKTAGKKMPFGITKVEGEREEGGGRGVSVNVNVCGSVC